MVVEKADTQGDGTPRQKAPRAERKKRRVSDDILHAFHFACDIKDLEMAQRLLDVLEATLSRRAQSPQDFQKQEAEAVVAAHERLWSLRRPNDR